MTTFQIRLRICESEHTRLGGPQCASSGEAPSERPFADKVTFETLHSSMRKHPISVQTAAAAKQGQPQGLCASLQSHQAQALRPSR